MIYTNRNRLDHADGRKEDELKISVEISDPVKSIVLKFSVSPKYLIAKGGITSSEIGTKGLFVKSTPVANGQGNSIGHHRSPNRMPASCSR